MGDPKKQRKLYSGPAILWNTERLEQERVITEEYGLKNKLEIWKMSSLVKKWTNDAKRLTTLQTHQAAIEKEHLLRKLKAYGFLHADAQLSDTLGVTLKSLLERRLQTLVYRKKLGYSISQARQFIAHGHIFVNGVKITSPSYLVPLAEESSIAFAYNSPYHNIEHPERAKERKEKKRKETRPARGTRDARRERRRPQRRKYETAAKKQPAKKE